MKTKLPNEISTVQQAKDYLKALVDNGESYHPEDNAFDIGWNLPKRQIPTPEEMDQLNNLMDQIYDLEGFDPCEFILSLNDEKE